MTHKQKAIIKIIVYPIIILVLTILGCMFPFSAVAIAVVTVIYILFMFALCEIEYAEYLDDFEKCFDKSDQEPKVEFTCPEREPIKVTFNHVDYLVYRHGEWVFEHKEPQIPVLFPEEHFKTRGFLIQDNLNIVDLLPDEIRYMEENNL